MSKITVDLIETDIKTALKIMTAESGVDSFATLAAQLDMKSDSLRSAVNKGYIRLRDFVEISRLLGFKIIVEKE